MTGRAAAYAGCGLSLAIGLVFVFVRAPHPWGWEGIDGYRELAQALARGEAYPTLERVWGYPLFLAPFYALFGDRQWVPLVVQVLLNATLPLLVFALARRSFDARTAGMAALLTGVFSFNTVYASTQAADALCTVTLVASLVCFAKGEERRAVSWYAISGVLCGMALLLRPNLLLFPACLAMIHVTFSKHGRQWAQLGVFLVAAGLVWAPWPIRNYQVAQRFIPATTHGGIQLWYGSLQESTYFERWFDNPRAQLESSPFEYSRPDGQPILVEASPALSTYRPNAVSLVYWTDRIPTPATLAPVATASAARQFAIPPQPDRTVVSYYLVASENGAAEYSFPAAGPRNPMRHIVSNDHFGDVDFDGGFVDIFDVVRLAQREAGHDVRGLDLDLDGQSTRADLNVAIGVLVVPALRTRQPDLGAVSTIEQLGTGVRLVMKDGSSVAAPYPLLRTTDLIVSGSDATLAANLIRGSRTLASLTLPDADVPELLGTAARPGFQVRCNGAFQKSEPLKMDRYNALAADNIARNPQGFAVASAKRLVRLFVILGSEDGFRSFQFTLSRLIFAAGTLASLTLVGLFVAGAVIAWRRNASVAVLLLPVVYMPATIFPFLTNMRYSLTVQPLVMILVAVSLIAIGDRVKAGRTIKAS